MQQRINQIARLGYDAFRLIDEHQFLAVQAMLGRKGQLNLCSNLYGPDESYCYQRLADALAEMARWNPNTEPEPRGWIRHIQSGRCRPDGDPAKEYIQL